MSSKRNILPVSTKINIIRDAEEGHLRNRELSTKYKLSASTVTTILNNRERIKSDWVNTAASTTRKHLTATGPLEKALTIWFTQQRSLNVPISGPILAEKARQMAQELGIMDFKASNGFIDRFKKRNGIVFKTVQGEAASADNEAASRWKVEILPHFLNRYAARDVYNADESALFFDCLPNKTLAFRGNRCEGGKKSKLRVTLLFCTNMDGSDKRQLLLIGKSAKPRCFKSINPSQLPVHYASNQKAWMNRQLWFEWLKKFDKQMSRAGRRVLLIVDNVSSHAVPLELQAVELAFLPPHTTSRIQPCDQGIIASFKAHYRSTLVKRMLLHIQVHSSIDEFRVSILDAIHLAARAWNAVSTETIAHCFVKAGFAHNPAAFANTNSLQPVEGMPELQNIWDILQQDLGSSFNLQSSVEDFVHVDGDVATEGVLTDVDILQQVRGNEDDEEEEDFDQSIQQSPVSLAAAVASLFTIRQFCTEQEDGPHMLAFAELETFLATKATQRRRQTTLDDFVIRRS